MAQVNPDSYLALTNNVLGSQADGLYLDRTTGDIVVFVNGVEDSRLPSANRCRIFEDFIGTTVISATVGPNGLRIKDTSTAGSPTLAVKQEVSGGVFEMAFDNTNEAQVLTLYSGDNQVVDYSKKPVFKCRMKIPVAPLSTDFLVWGLATAQNDTEDSVATNAWFRIEGANLAVKLETDDGTTDTDDKDPSLTLTADTWYDFLIDLANTSNVKFYYRNSNTPSNGTAWTSLTVPGTTFSIAANTTNLQPFLQLRKTGGTGTTGIQMDYLDVAWAR